MNKQQIAVTMNDDGGLQMCKLTDRGRTEEIETSFEPWGDWIPFDTWEELVEAAKVALKV